MMPEPATEVNVPRDPSQPRWVEVGAVVGILGVVAYLASWFAAGLTSPGYDAIDQAISELFAIGAHTPGRWWLVGSLVFAGAALVVFGAVMHRALPGQGRAGPAAAMFSGVMTAVLVVAPCSEGCPGMGSSPTDTWHTLIAASGYVALLITPLLTARRLAPHAPRIAAWSLVTGIVGAVGFAVRYLGVIESYGGLQQRAFNTVADLWFVAIAVWILVRGRVRGRDGHDAASEGDPPDQLGSDHRDGG